jgi:hypothetical protein
MLAQSCHSCTTFWLTAFTAKSAHTQWCICLLAHTLHRVCAAVLATVILWPTYATDSYLKWRVPALSFLRVFLVALPFNFSTVVFNAIAPNVGTGGRFAVVGLSFQAFMGETQLAHMDARTVTSLHKLREQRSFSLFSVQHLGTACMSLSWGGCRP